MGQARGARPTFNLQCKQVFGEGEGEEVLQKVAKTIVPTKAKVMNGASVQP